MKLLFTVTAQELRATWRDKRTLSSSILVPLLVIPLITVGLPLLISHFLAGERQQRQVVGVVGALPPELRTLLTGGQAGESGVTLINVTDPRAAVQSGQVDAVIAAQHVPSSAQQRGAAQLYYKLGNLKAESGAAAKVTAAVSAYNRQLAARELQRFGLPESTLEPLSLRRVDASRPAESRSGALAFLIPLFLLQFILAGATAAATDSTAGERERGTLEALLSTPAPRPVLLAGKLLATTVTALSAAACSLLGLTLSAPLAALLSGGAASRQAAQAAFGGSLQLGAGSLAGLFALVSSAALLLSALLLLLSLFARSVREAQTLSAPLSLLIVLPAALLQFADFWHASPLLYALPLIGSMLSILEMVKGSLSSSHALLSLAGNLLTAALLALLALRFFGREGVVFRQ